jgi:hypothetical protein
MFGYRVFLARDASQSGPFRHRKGLSGRPPGVRPFSLEDGYPWRAPLPPKSCIWERLMMATRVDQELKILILDSENCGPKVES